MKFRVSFPDRLPPTDRLPLNYMSPMVVHNQPTSMEVWAENKREAWRHFHNQFPFERIVIEEVKDA